MKTNPHFDCLASTISYYDAHAAEYCAATLAADMSELYAPFLSEIEPRGRILDAGCGSGRDSMAFMKKGYQVVSIDASEEMVTATSKLTGQPALLMPFDQISFKAEFDGIWACASLLHIPRSNLNVVLKRLTNALKPSGTCYVSFKHGDSERIEDGRYFNDLNETLFQRVLGEEARLELLQLWLTNDVRRAHQRKQRWLNALVRRIASNA